MAKRKRRAFSAEFKAEAVRLCRVGDRSVAQVAKDLDLAETSLREWVKQPPEEPSGRGQGSSVSDAEREELVELRKAGEAARDGEGNPKKAAAFFAKEST